MRKDFTMRFIRVFSLLFAAFFCCNNARAQFAVGEKVIVVKDGPITSENGAVDVVTCGMGLRVNAVKGDKLRVSHKVTGWIDQKHVAAPSRAIEIFSKYIDRNPGDPEAYHRRGMAWKNLREFDRAIADFNESIRLDPMPKRVYGDRGNCWLMTGKFDMAISDFSELIRLDPDEITGYSNRAAAWNEKSEFDSAIADATEAIRLSPTFGYAYWARAVGWQGKQQCDKAIADYSEAIRIDPNDDVYLNNLARLLATCSDEKNRDGRRAVELATRACEQTNWKDTTCIDTLAAACAEVGNFEKAVEWQDLVVARVSKSQRAKCQDRLELYKAGLPYRDGPKN
jgi:Flp pilus assembly protein TadD